MSRRHPNIHNEILMEKRVLHKLGEHPGIVSLYSTFQDAGTLYYLMEYLGGNDLWTHLHVELNESEIKKKTKKIDENSSLTKIEDDDDADDVDKAGDHSKKNENKDSTETKYTSQVGLHWSQIKFYFAEMISAIEYMHR
jgi:serine/threonine protein kinase